MLQPFAAFRRSGAAGQISDSGQSAPARLAVPTPTESLLSDDAAALWAHDMAQAMVGQSVPAIAQPRKKGDWWLKMSAATRNGAVVPHYVIMTPEGKSGRKRMALPWTWRDGALATGWHFRAPRFRKLRNWRTC